ncbi:ABC-2 family transporter protein [Thalassoglobus sp. JC818]|uniref:ABC transporter permease n=1 Tax=Thalassoglobus sp. JC818 TaxID=3232136 RepID=UPI00345A7060
MTDDSSPSQQTFRPNYLAVWGMFFRNSLIREMTFRSNFVIELVTRAFWFSAQLVLFDLIYRHVPTIQDWSREEYFAFMATGMLINALVEAFFMPNCANFSELIRTGDLDFALLKPIDTQFLISFEKVNFAMINQVLLAVALLWYSISRTGIELSIGRVITYLMLILVGVAFFYSLMIALASTSVWFGRNQGLYDFWFYITIFARYPQGFYKQSFGGEMLWFGFSFIVPILLVVTVPSRFLLRKALDPNWTVLVIAPLSTLVMVLISRRIFQWSLSNYRSASS